jgi:hypothetical protein
MWRVSGNGEAQGPPMHEAEPQGWTAQSHLIKVSLRQAPIKQFSSCCCCPVARRIDFDANHKAVGRIRLTVGDAAKRFVTSTNRSDRQLFIELPTSRGDDSGTVTANVDGRSDFERGIVCSTKVDKHLQRDPNFLPAQEGRFCHSDVLRAGRSNGAIVPSGIKRAMVFAGARQPVNATTEFLLRWNGKGQNPHPYEPKAKGAAPEVAFTDNSVGHSPRNVVCRSKLGVAPTVLDGFCTAHRSAHALG